MRTVDWIELIVYWIKLILKQIEMRMRGVKMIAMIEMQMQIEIIELIEINSIEMLTR
jgi:hypothetical protein